MRKRTVKLYRLNEDGRKLFAGMLAAPRELARSGVQGVQPNRTNDTSAPPSSARLRPKRGWRGWVAGDGRAGLRLTGPRLSAFFATQHHASTRLLRTA